jgi:hypothetical protein
MTAAVMQKLKRAPVGQGRRSAVAERVVLVGDRLLRGAGNAGVRGDGAEKCQKGCDTKKVMVLVHGLDNSLDSKSF